ncbi:MAG: tail fiber protein [Shewanella xiamenensis]|nr:MULTISPECIES: tail fiber protein [unclassified Shewanella]MCD8550548.1 tail fiber protein [Shewanella xiamenensis]KPN77206.1 tail protein [Shewanella sp. Sh95]MCD8558399.1 tail fiber protein [Shewanella xiamenensis]MCT8858967.1 tail fiber protein [Shewanella xiamenensis]MDN5501270.1 tail fiber protein [Shewanella sp.]
MSDPFIGEIRMFAGTFAPRGWALCNGQLLAISTNSALFSILGTTYGGNGTTTFGLPNLQSRTPVGTGTGTGLSNVVLGQVAGVENVNLTTNQLPIHAPTATFIGNASSVTATVDVATTTATAMVPPAAGATTYLSATTAKAGPTSVAFHGLFTSTAPDSTKSSLGGVHGSVTPAGTVTVNPVGGGQPVGIRNPYLGMNFIIALEGIYPSRN